FETAEVAMRLLVLDEIARVFIESVQVTDLLPAFKGIKLDGELLVRNVTAAGESALVVTTNQTTSFVKPRCPEISAAAEIQIITKGSTGPDFHFGSTVIPVNPAPTPVHANGSFQLAVYGPRAVMDEAFVKVLPAVRIGGSGSWNGVNYSWTISI